MKLNLIESFGVTINAGILAIFYTMFGALISYIFYHIFDEFDDTWKERSNMYKFSDVALELVIIGIVAFWSSRITDILPPFFPVRKQLDSLVDGYISGIFFIFAMFLFLNDLTEKLKFLHEEYLGPHVSKVIPQHGSIVDLSLSYTPPKV